MWMIAKSVNKKLFKCHLKCIRRQISALYITGDKANEHYVTLQPYMNFEEKFNNKAALVDSIKHRNLRIDLDAVLAKYGKFKLINEQIKQLDKEREENANKLKQLLKQAQEHEDAANALKEQGKLLRNELKQLKDTLYPIEDDFVHAYLNLPNNLHALCPTSSEKLLYKQTGCNVEGHKTVAQPLLEFVDENRYYLLGDAALFDLQCMQALQQYFVHTAKFTPMANPDFVRCVLLEANATTSDQYHQVVEHNMQNKINNAFLTGGGAFESFLGAVTKLSVYRSVLPLRWISCGRSYHRQQCQRNLYTATQTNAVQTFVATDTAEQADEQMEVILNCVANFYNTLDLSYRIVYTKASDLSLTECLRASIDVFSPAQNSYVTLGYVSNYGNYLSQRILFNMRDKDKYRFPYVLGGPILYTSRLIAALQEYNIPLENRQFLSENYVEKEKNAFVFNKI